MDELHVIIQKDEENDTLIVMWESNSVVIDYSIDVDFTPLVDTLAESIGDNKQLSIDEFDKEICPKGSLVLRTIQDIINKYNDVVTTTVNDENDIPF